MKAIYKNVFNTALGALIGVALAIPASAQHRTASGGGGGGSSSSGSSSRPAVSASPAPSRAPSSGNVGVSRPSVSVRQPSGGSFARPNNNGQARVGIAPRGNYGYGTARPNVGVTRNYGFPSRSIDATHRPATAGSSGYVYRNSPHIGYGRGGYWGNHNYYHYNRGYYGSYYAPRLGFSIGVLPYGYYPFYYGDFQYYYSDGLFYQYDNNEYTVVEPPIGAEVKELPEKAQSIVINGQQYYELNGVYYQPVTKDDGSTVYQVAGKDGELNTGTNVDDDQYQGPQMGDIVGQLPPDCRKIKVNGEKLYVSPDGVYYQETTDDKGNKAYKVVGLPTDEQQPE
ncbi:MAG TPA: DUF6515 family protein [Mucilaginibacter sp.]